MAESKLEHAYISIRGDILAGRLLPGQRLVVDTIARDLKMSPVPVREAIRRLQSDGLLLVERNVGARVAALDEVQWEQAMHALALLDGYAFADAAANITPQIIAEARAVNDRMRDGSNQATAYAEVLGLNREFHSVIYQACENRFTVDLVSRVWDRIDANRAIVALYGATRSHNAVEEHDALLDLLSAGTTPLNELEKVARQHNLNAITAFRTGAGGSGGLDIGSG